MFADDVIHLSFSVLDKFHGGYKMKTAELEEQEQKVEEQQKTNIKEVSTAFKWFHATSLNGGAMLIAAIISSYFAVYMTDNLLIPAATASMIMFTATLWDAINDPIMGIIADRTNTKWGRYRPYFIFAPILLTFFSTMLWIDWGFTPNATVAYILVMYIGYGMTVTMFTMPQMAVLPACVKDNKTRNQIITFGAGCTALMFTIGNTFTMQIVGFFQGLGFENGYVPIMLICGFASMISFWGLFKTSKEKYLQPIEKGNPLREVGLVLKHKELLPNIIAWIMASMGFGMMFATSVYYMLYYYMRPDLIPVYMGVISIGSLVSMTVVMPIVLKKFKTGQKALIVSQIVSIACYIVLFFFGTSNFTFLCALTFISTAFAGMQNALVNVLVNDSIDLIQYKEGISANGVISSIKGFAQKCGNTVVNSGILALLAATGYIAGAVGGQPDATMFALNFLKFGAPTITGIILILCVRYNPVEKYAKEIEEMKANMTTSEENK